MFAGVPQSPPVTLLAAVKLLKGVFEFVSGGTAPTSYSINVRVS